MGCPCGSLFRKEKMQFLYIHCFCRRAIEIDEEEDDKNVLSIPREELDAVIRELSAHLENLKTCNDLIAKHGSALQRALAELENGGADERTKIVTERATLFRISSNAMISVSVTLAVCLFHFIRYLFYVVITVIRSRSRRRT